MKMIEPIQVQLIHIAKTQLGLSREEYEAAIMGQTKGKKQSSKELSYFEADGLINYFKTLGFKIQSSYIRTSGAARRARWQPANDRRRARKNPGNVVMMPSKEQLTMIGVLAKKVPWRLADGYRRWLTERMKIERIVTSEQAIKVIEGLKGLLQHSGR
jgi:hypothetical protein